MATFKHVFEFIDVNGSTWREIYYRTGSSIGGELQVPLDVYNARVALLATPHTFLRDRISNVDVVRQTARRTLNIPGLAAVGQIQGVADITPAPGAAVISIVGLTGGSRYLWMRGTSGTVYTNDASGRPNPGGDFRSKLGVFLNQLNANQFGLRTLITPATNKYSAVSLVDGKTQPGQAILTLATPIAGVLAGSKITVGGFDPKVFPALKGQFTVIAIGTSAGGQQTVQIPYATPANALLTPQSGKARLAAYNAVSVVDVANSNFAYNGSRITKSPYSNSRGARRAARIRQLP